MEVVVHQAVVVLDAPLQQQLVGDGAELPPRGDVAGRPPPAQLLDEIDALVEHRGLLLAGHRDGVLVRVAVHPDLVAGVGHHAALVGEGLGGVAGDEPGGADAEAPEQLHQPRHPHLAGEQAARDVAGRVLAPVGAEPPGHRVHVDPECAEDLLPPASPAAPGQAAPARHGGGDQWLGAVAAAGGARGCRGRGRRSAPMQPVLRSQPWVHGYVDDGGQGPGRRGCGHRSLPRVRGQADPVFRNPAGPGRAGRSLAAGRKPGNVESRLPAMPPGRNIGAVPGHAVPRGTPSALSGPRPTSMRLGVRVRRSPPSSVTSTVSLIPIPSAEAYT